MKSIDAFGSPVRWLLPGSKNVQQSISGSICTLLTWSILLAFALYRFVFLLDRSDYEILTEVQPDFFEETFALDSSNGFNVAAAVTSFGKIEDEEDPEIGTLEFYLKSWKDDLSPLVFTKLKSRKCTLDDFKDDHVNDDNDGSHSKFNPVHKESKSLFGYVPNMKCIDEPFKIFGSFNTNTASNLMITFEKCDP